MDEYYDSDVIAENPGVDDRAPTCIFYCTLPVTQAESEGHWQP
jgi:hypothetical protein